MVAAGVARLAGNFPFLGRDHMPVCTPVWYAVLAYCIALVDELRYLQGGTGCLWLDRSITDDGMIVR